MALVVSTTVLLIMAGLFWKLFDNIQYRVVKIDGEDGVYTVGALIFFVSDLLFQLSIVWALRSVSRSFIKFQYFLQWVIDLILVDLFWTTFLNPYDNSNYKKAVFYGLSGLIFIIYRYRQEVGYVLYIVAKRFMLIWLYEKLLLPIGNAISNLFRKRKK